MHSLFICRSRLAILCWGHRMSQVNGSWWFKTFLLGLRVVKSCQGLVICHPSTMFSENVLESLVTMKGVGNDTAHDTNWRASWNHSKIIFMGVLPRDWSPTFGPGLELRVKQISAWMNPNLNSATSTNLTQINSTTSASILQIYINSFKLQIENIFSRAVSVTDSWISCRYTSRASWAHQMERFCSWNWRNCRWSFCATNGIKTYCNFYQQEMLTTLWLCVESLLNRSSTASYPRTKLHSEHRNTYGKGAKTFVKTLHEVHCRYGSKCSIAAKIWLFSAGAIVLYQQEMPMF